MATLNTHKGTNLNWIAYKSGGNTFVINLLSNGDPVDITDYTFVVNITRANSSEEVLQLTEVDGITNGGEAGTLTINLSQADIEASLPGNDYWYEIAYTHSSVVAPLFQGTLTLSNKKNPGSTTTSLTPTINLGDTVVNVEVTLGGSGASTAEDVSFDNTDTGIEATNVQGAIQELDGDIETLASEVDGKADADGVWKTSGLTNIDEAAGVTVMRGPTASGNWSFVNGEFPSSNATEIVFTSGVDKDLALRARRPGGGVGGSISIRHSHLTLSYGDGAFGAYLNFHDKDASAGINVGDPAGVGFHYESDFSIQGVAYYGDLWIPHAGWVKAQIAGLQDLPIMAPAMWPRATNGCAALARTEIATSIVNIQSLDFDQTTQEFAQFQIVLPRNWNRGTVTARFYWTAASGTAGQTVQWGISGGAYSNDDALTAALGTAQTVDDSFIAANDIHVTDYTSAITLAGSPQDADFLVFQVSRNPASDNLAADAKLLGVVITLTTDSGVAA